MQHQKIEEQEVVEQIAQARPASRVLLVEDNSDHAFLAVTVLRQLLGDWSEVVVAENYDQAVEMIGRFTECDRPDLIMVDLRLPHDGGFGVLTAAREHDALAPLPVFVVTSSLYDMDVELSYRLGATAVLTKPLSRAKLRAELRRVGALG